MALLKISSEIDMHTSIDFNTTQYFKCLALVNSRVEMSED